jgi:hypothetical protein
VRIATGILVLALTTGGARAEIIAVEPKPAIQPVKAFSWAAYFSGLGGAVNGTSVTALGPSGEVALGLGRTQLLLEVGAYYTTAGITPDYMQGFMLRTGVGARWIARSFSMDGDGAIDMVLDGLVGGEKTWWENDEELLRPEIIAGVGLQVRKHENPSFAIRFMLRLYFAPTDDEIHVPMSAAARCAGSCEPDSHSNGGIMFAIGGGM